MAKRPPKVQRPSAVPIGEQTGRQATLLAGPGSAFSLASLPGFLTPHPGTYAHYRRMRADPTIALARLLVTGPILAGSETVEGDEDAPEERKEFVQKWFECRRWQIFEDALRYLDYGWRGYEQCWEMAGPKLAALAKNPAAVIVDKLKSLLPEFTYIDVDETGNFAGLSQTNFVKSAELRQFKACLLTYDGESGNLYGRARMENIRDAHAKSEQIANRAAQLAGKAAAIIPQIHYPMGEGKDATGATVSNFDVARKCLEGLQSGKGIVLPNLFHNTDDPRVSAELAGKSAYVISFLEATGAAAALQGLTEHLRYYDVLKLRGWLVPERSAIEAQTAGSRADSQSATDQAINGSDLVHMDLCAQLSRGPVDDMLAMNFGEDARGSVYLKASPLKDEKREQFAKIIDAVLLNAATLEELLSQIDMSAVAKAIGLPVPTGKKLTFSMVAAGDGGAQTASLKSTVTGRLGDNGNGSY